MSDEATYDSSWDEDDQKAWEKKRKEWEKRDWLKWLRDSLAFPFETKREDDDDGAFFMNSAGSQPSRLGHRLKVMALDDYSFSGK